MSNFERFGRAHRFRKFGTGHGQVNPPPDVQRTIADFSKGYASLVARENLPEGAASYMSDFYVTDRNRLRRLPGTDTDETFVDRHPKQMVLQAALENRSEVVFIDAPYVGIKSSDATVWTDEGLDDSRPYGFTNYGGTLVFSNGVETAYYREAGGEIVATEDIPPARAYASSAGRLLAGGAIIDGRYEPLGMAWSSPFGLTDFDSKGSGSELLINDMSIGDRIISVRSMGLDYVAILLRHSIWIGARTGLLDRPWDFQPRVAGMGVLADSMVQVTRLGVIFVSDTGIYIFDGMQAQSISDPIDADILPILGSNIENYSTSYNPKLGWFYLFTPTATWIYDLAYKRWYRSSMVAKGGVPFAEQFDSTTWGEITGTWAEQELTWGDFSPAQSDDSYMLFMAEPAGSTVLAAESTASESFFGTPFTAIYDSPLQQHEMRNKLITSTLLNIEYTGLGTLEVYMPDNNSEWNQVVTETLSNAAMPTLVSIPMLHTGKGFGIRIINTTGPLEVIYMQLVGKARGPRIESSPFYPREYYNEF